MFRRISLSFLPALTLGSGLAAFAGAAQAQDPNYPYGDRRYENRRYDDRGYDNRRYDNRRYAYVEQPDSARRGGALFDRVQQDLDQASRGGYTDGRTLSRIDHARKNVWDFQRRWQEGRYSRHELDEAIGAVQNVVNHGSLGYRERRLLQDDLFRMREFRSRLG